MIGGGILSDDDELLAAELALRLLDPPEHEAGLARAGADQTLAAALARWEERAAGLFDGDGEAPPASLWPRIVRQLPANDDTIARRTSATATRPWQLATAVASAAAVAFAALSLRQAPPGPIAPAPVVQPAPAPAPALVAVLRGEGDAVVAVSFDRASGRLTTTPSSFALKTGAAELWVIPADGRPRSLGVIDAGAPGTRAAPPAAARAIAPGTTLAISLEPAGGSPTGQPTGEVIITGKVAQT